MMNNTILGDYIHKSLHSDKVIYWSAGSLFVSVLFLFWAGVKGVVANSLIPILLAFLINELMIVYGFSQKANPWCISGVCLLNLCAAMCQTVFSFMSDWYIYAFGLVVIICLVVFMRKVSYGWIAFWSAFGMIVLLGMCLLPIVPRVAGVKAWLYLGGRPVLQLTEFAKLFFVFFLGSLYATKCSEKRKFVLSAMVTLFAFVILFYANEFGTLLVMGSSLVALILTTFKKKGYKTLSLLAVLALVVFAILGYNLAAKHMDKWTCPDCQMLNQKTLQCETCNKEPVFANFNFKCPTCHYTSWGREEIESFTKNCPICREDTFLQSMVGKVCQKLYARGSATFDYEFQSESCNAFHVVQNLQAIKTGRFFGNMDALITVPNNENDSILAGMMNRLGLLFAIVTLLSFFFIFLGIKRASSSVRMAAIFAVVFQAFYTFAGTINFLPMTGIGLPLLSSGGSNMVVGYVLIYLMLSAVRNREEA